MQISVEAIPPCRLAYMRKTGPYSSKNAQLMEKLKIWAKRNKLFEESIILVFLKMTHK